MDGKLRNEEFFGNPAKERFSAFLFVNKKRLRNPKAPKRSAN